MDRLEIIGNQVECVQCRSGFSRRMGGSLAVLLGLRTSVGRFVAMYLSPIRPSRCPLHARGAGVVSVALRNVRGYDSGM